MRPSRSESQPANLPGGIGPNNGGSASAEPFGRAIPAGIKNNSAGRSLIRQTSQSASRIVDDREQLQVAVELVQLGA